MVFHRICAVPKVSFLICIRLHTLATENDYLQCEYPGRVRLVMCTAYGLLALNRR